MTDGANATKPADPERTGWNFAGWYVGDTEYTFAEKVTADVKVTARYTSVIGGEGTKASPFTIDNAEDFKNAAEFIGAGAYGYVNGVYTQTADIESALTAPIANFGGEYDGGNHTLNVSATLFGTLTGTVKNITLDGTVKGAGLLAETADGATVTDITAFGSVTSSATAGGLVGTQAGGRIEYADVAVTVLGKTVGGIAGKSSGAIVNSLAKGNITAYDIGGGIVGELDANGLVQNCGFGNLVNAGTAAGGIAGTKKVDSGIYRGFVYGLGSISADNAGGIVGSEDFDLLKYEDVVDCFIDSDITVTGKKTVTEGEKTVAFFGTLVLPEAIWDKSGDYPALRTERGELPASVTVTVGGEDKTVAYGSKAGEDLFSASGVHYSPLFELDNDVTLTKIEFKTSPLGGSFTDAYASLEFTANGAVYTPDASAAAKNLTFTGGRVNYETYTDSWYGDEIPYRADVYGYTDGETEYAFIIEKEETDAGFVGYMYMFAKTNGKWALSHNWNPKAENFAGAYKIADGNAAMYLVVNGEYTVSEGSSESEDKGYYLTRYFMISDGELACETFSQATTSMFFGEDVDATEFTAALVFIVDEEDGSVDFVYFDDGELTSAVYSKYFGAYEATADLMDGSWYNGTDVFAIDAEEGTVKVGNGSPVQYTLDEGGNYIKFTANGTEYKLMIGLNEFGSYKLYSADGVGFVAVVYAESTLCGTWLSGDTAVAVTNDTALYITVNGTAATEVQNAVYNDSFALRFTVGSTEYYLVNFSDIVSVLYANGKESYAVNREVIEDFTGSYVTFVNGTRYDLTVNDDFTGSLQSGNDATNVTPGLEYNELLGVVVLRLKIGPREYIAVWFDESTLLVMDVLSGDMRFYITEEDMAKYIVSEYTSGKQMLEISENGKYVIYDRGSDKAAATKTALTATYLEKYNFALVAYDADGNAVNFFTRTPYAANMQYAEIDEDGDVTVIAIFVPDAKMQQLVGVYVYDNGRGDDTITIHADGRMTETFTDADGVFHDEDEQEWFPQINYNEISGQESMIALIRSYTTGMVVYAYHEPKGLEFYSGQMVYYVQALYPYTGYIYQNAAHNSFSFKGGKVAIGTVSYAISEVTVSGGNVTLTLTYGDETVTVVFHDGDKATVTAGGVASEYTGEVPQKPEDLIGSYVADDVTYVVEEYAFISTTIQLKYTTDKAYTLSYEALYINKQGKQTFKFSSFYPVAEKYVYLSGSDIVIADDLNGTNAVTAVRRGADVNALDGKTFVAADGNGKVEFALSSGFFATMFVTVTDASGSEKEYSYDSCYFVSGVFTVKLLDEDGDPFAFEDTYAYLHCELNDNFEIIAFTFGDTEEVKAGEVKYVNPDGNKTLDKNKLAGTYKTADESSTVSFSYLSFLDSFYMTLDGKMWSVITSETYENGKFVLVLDTDGAFDDGEGTKYIFITTDDSGEVTKVEIADTEDGATTEYLPVAD